MENLIKQITLIVSLSLLVSCSKDETIKPVDIMEVTPELRTIQDQAEQLGRLGRDIEGRVQRTLTAAQTAAQIQMAAEQRDVNLELMKLTEIKDGKKLLLAGKYFALLDFQLYQNSEKFEYQSVKRFLKDTVPLFPKELTLKNAMREDKSFNLYALSIAMDAVNPGRTMPAQSFLDIVYNGLAAENNNVVSSNDATQLILENKEKFQFLLQLRQNALYDITIQYFDKTPLNIFKKFTVTGVGLDLNVVKQLHKFILLADKTRNKITELNIPLKEYKNRRRKLKAMKLKIHKSVTSILANALTDIHRHIKETY